YLKRDSAVIDTVTGELSQKIVNEPELWAIDEVAGDLLNINRVLKPYPGAFCSWVNKKDVVLVMERHIKSERRKA
ncbi:MAG: hypothetical protein KJ655_02535, partial [Candidatus Thermoplasmatota archaeon]|nr:hypothetical protein [Candidatus Thermoplasmatota archaeon]